MLDITCFLYVWGKPIAEFQLWGVKAKVG